MACAIGGTRLKDLLDEAVFRNSPAVDVKGPGEVEAVQVGSKWWERRCYYRDTILRLIVSDRRGACEVALKRVKSLINL